MLSIQTTKWRIILIGFILIINFSLVVGQIREDLNINISEILDKHIKNPHLTQYSWIFSYRKTSSSVTKEQIEALCKIIQESSDEGEKISAALVLAEMGSEAKDAIPVLYSSLPDIYSFTSLYAEIALIRMGQPAVEEICRKVFYPGTHQERICRGYGVQILVALAPLSVSEVSKYVRKDDVRVRRLAVDILGKLGPQAISSVPLLIESFEEDKDELVRLEAAFALWKIKRWERSLPYLCEALESRDMEVKSDAILMIKYIGFPARTSLPILVKILEEECQKKEIYRDCLGHPITSDIINAIEKISGLPETFTPNIDKWVKK